MVIFRYFWTKPVQKCDTAFSCVRGYTPIVFFPSTLTPLTWFLMVLIQFNDGLLSDRWTHLAMVGAAVFCHSTLTVHQEAVSAAFLGQGRLVSLCDEGVQLGLLTADGFHKLKHRVMTHTLEMMTNEGLGRRRKTDRLVRTQLQMGNRFSCI